MGYAMGVLFAFVVSSTVVRPYSSALTVVTAQVAAQTSGGHFNPGVSIAFVLMRRMSLRKALR